MLSAGGAGEVPISISGDPAAPETLVHTVRAVGSRRRRSAPPSPASAARARPVRQRLAGRRAEGADVVVVAGGIGLAPLRPAILALLARRERYGRLVLLYGGALPDQLLYSRSSRRGRSAASRSSSPSTAPAPSGSATSAS